MNKRQELEKYNLKALRYQKKKKVDIISTENSRYCLKEENNTNNNLSNVYTTMCIKEWNPI